jgi:GMP synthase-like glutamine amidotransferase
MVRNLPCEHLPVRVLAIVNQSDAGPGVFADAIAASGAVLDRWRPYADRDPPRPIESYDGVITLGGAMNADQDEEYPWLATERALLGRLLRAGVPMLGVCLGAQLLAEAAGAKVGRASTPEIGWLEVETTAEANSDRLFGPLAPRVRALQWHSYKFALAPGAVALARSEVCLQAFRVGEVAWGIQFHAEVSAADLDHWIDDYRSDPDAVAIGLDPEALRADSVGRIARWNELGRDLCRRFLAVAAGQSPQP